LEQALLLPTEGALASSATLIVIAIFVVAPALELLLLISSSPSTFLPLSCSLSSFY